MQMLYQSTQKNNKCDKTNIGQLVYFQTLKKFMRKLSIIKTNYNKLVL